MPPTHVFFFRGLSTYNQDNAAWSFMNFGPVHAHLSAAFAERGILLHPVLGMGSGDLDTITSRAREFLAGNPIWRNPEIPVHLFGHSAGGLIARTIEAETRGRIVSCMTVATAHQGSFLAERCGEIPSLYRGTNRILKTLGYNVEAKKSFFAELTPASVRGRMQRLLPGDSRRASVICVSPSAEWCWPLRWMHRLPAFHDFPEASDGFVERETQAFGEVIEEVNIDHFRQVGMFGQRYRFLNLCDILARFFSEAKGG